MKNINYEYGYDYEDDGLEEFREVPPGKELGKSSDLKIEHALAQFTNDVHEIVYNEKTFDIQKIEKALLKNLLKEFNNTETAKLSGLSIRTIRNKKNAYGLREAI